MVESLVQPFKTEEGILVPAITSGQMREVDRIADEEFGYGILQMMENAGRTLALNVLEMLGGTPDEVTVLAGPGGNGGGGLCCARHLHNRGVRVNILLDRGPSTLTGAARHQWYILEVAGIKPVETDLAAAAISRSQLVVDALIGYGMRGAPHGRAAELIELCNERAPRVLSLDVPSGLSATTGDAPGLAVRPDRTLTLALPKTGLRRVPGELFLADIGIPPEVYRRIDLVYEPPFRGRYWVRIQPVTS